MSSSQENIDRFNKYKSMADSAGSACIRTFLHIVRPTEGFPYYSNYEIRRTWNDWKDAKEVFFHMTSSGWGWDASDRPNYVFPTPPPEDAEHKPCRQMWGCLVQEQVEGESFQAPLIKDAVTAIMASEACKSHPASCPCKVPNNPWKWHECVAALEPLNLKHSPKCQCGGYMTCKQAQEQAQKQAASTRVIKMMSSAIGEAEAELAANPRLIQLLPPCRCDAQYSPVSCSCLPGRLREVKGKMSPVEKRGWEVLAQLEGKASVAVAVAAPVPTPTKSAFDYKHNVDTCACGTCYKARVDSGTEDAYIKRCRENSERSLAKMNSRLLQREESFKESCPDCKASARGTCVECHVAQNSYDERHYLKMPSVLHAIRQAYYLEEPFYIDAKREDEKEAAAPAAGGSGFAEALNKASSAISTAAAKAGGADKPDFAKELFAAMGTPHDSKCPHGLPFYACMPCSH